jgi:hypothetical protein
VLVKLLYRMLALLIAATYLGATIAAAALPVESCLALEGRGQAAHQQSGQHSHHHGSSRTSAGECLKCCLGACVAAPCLPNPAMDASELAFDGTPVLYWAVWPAISGRAIAPDPGPPKPIS